jgi:ribosomal protein L11 methyltransferase
MHCLILECDAAEKDLLAAELWERGTEGIVENDLPGERTRLQAFFADGTDQAALTELFTAHGAVWERVEEVDWNARMRESWQAFPVGERFYLVPAWREDAAPEGRLRLEIDPGMAFGTGTHATTQLCMEALERVLRPEDRVLDLGTGSGILARAAAMLGARSVVGCDIDVDAAGAALANIRKASLNISIFAGSARSVRAGSVDLLLANINAETLVGLAGEMAGMLAAGGRAVVTGFTPLDRERVTGALAGVRLTILEAREKDGWSALVCRR